MKLSLIADSLATLYAVTGKVDHAKYFRNIALQSHGLAAVLEMARWICAPGIDTSDDWERQWFTKVLLNSAEVIQGACSAVELETFATCALEWAQQDADDFMAGRARLLRAFALQQMKRFADADLDLDSAQREFEAVGESYGIAQTQSLRAMVAERRIREERPQEPDYEAVRKLIGQARESAASLPELRRRQLQCSLQSSLAFLEQSAGDFPAATEAFSEALESARFLANPLVESRCLYNLGVQLAASGQFAAAVLCLGKALELATQSGAAESQMRCLYHLGRALMVFHKPVKILDCFQQAIALSRDLNQPDWEGGSIFTLGDYPPLLAFDGDLAKRAMAVGAYLLGQSDMNLGAIEKLQEVTGMDNSALRAYVEEQGRLYLANGGSAVRDALAFAYNRIGATS